MDLWAEFKILDMGQRLGRFIGMYQNNYFTPDKRNGQIIYSYRLLPGADKAIYQRISDITISMKASNHLKMPELVIKTTAWWNYPTMKLNDMTNYGRPWYCAAGNGYHCCQCRRPLRQTPANGKRCDL